MGDVLNAMLYGDDSPMNETEKEFASTSLKMKAVFENRGWEVNIGGKQSFVSGGLLVRGGVLGEVKESNRV